VVFIYEVDEREGADIVEGGAAMRAEAIECG
jgi:hypothetical protein